MLLAIAWIDGPSKRTQPRLLAERLQGLRPSISFTHYGQTSSSNLITKKLNGQCGVVFRFRANVRNPVDQQGVWGISLRHLD